MQAVGATKAREHFGAVLGTVQREPVLITRHGCNAAVVVSDAEWQRLKSGNAVAWFQNYAARAAQAMTPSAQALSDKDVGRIADALRA